MINFYPYNLSRSLQCIGTNVQYILILIVITRDMPCTRKIQYHQDPNTAVIILVVFFNFCSLLDL
jgi:hypothetical protein